MSYSSHLLLKVVIIFCIAATLVGALCGDGQYGENCTQTCPSKCKDGRCHPNDGTCRYCVDMFWGKYCNHSCSVYCQDVCEQFSGACNKCRVGYWTDDCTEPCLGFCDEYGCDQRQGKCVRNCETGFFGQICNRSCPVGCLNCKRSSGACYSCQKGYYGTFCHMTCPLNCVGECNRASGNCHTCIEGYWGVNCMNHCDYRCICDIITGNCTQCSAGYCGINCEKTCPNISRCGDSVCDRKSCECSSCYKSQYMGPHCEKPCPFQCSTCDINGTCSVCKVGSGKYGETCNLDCRNCSQDCDKKTGICEQCKNGTYGVNCDKSCGTNCEVCDRENGQCLHCVQGYFGERCSSICPKTCEQSCDLINGICNNCKVGNWGISCNFSCPPGCETKQCHRQTGVCQSCHPNYWGQACEKICFSKNCRHLLSDEIDGRCNKNNGYCESCKEGLWGRDCKKLCAKSCHGGCQISTGYCISCYGHAYGRDCEIPCSLNCQLHLDNPDNEICDRKGVCLHGCMIGLYGPMCNNKCQNCKGTICDQSTGLCLNGCLEGFEMNKHNVCTNDDDTQANPEEISETIVYILIIFFFVAPFVLGSIITSYFRRICDNLQEKWKKIKNADSKKTPKDQAVYTVSTGTIDLGNTETVNDNFDRASDATNDSFSNSSSYINVGIPSDSPRF